MDSIPPSSFTRNALLMGIDPIEALRMRYIYLKRQEQMFKELYLQDQCIDPHFWWWVQAGLQLVDLVNYAKRYKSKPIGNGITEDMIQTAKKYPINQLFDKLIRGRTQCFHHNSKAHDLSYHTKSNTMHCFGACCKSFNTIDILMLRDGMSFQSAVRFLQ